MISNYVFLLVALSAVLAVVDAKTWVSGCFQERFDTLDASNPTGCHALLVTTQDACFGYCVDTFGSNTGKFCTVEDDPFDSEIFQYCDCGQSSSGPQGCAENRCDNNCLNLRVTLIQLAVGGATTALLFIVGEITAACRGTKDDICHTGSKDALCFMTTYGLYYVIFFLTIFDWMSDVAWLFVDVLDSNFRDIFEEKGLNYYVFFIVSASFLGFSTFAAFVPFMVADFRVHFSKSKDNEAPACVAPYSWLPCRVPFTDRTFKTLRLKPVIVMRMVLLNILLLDLPQITLQVFLSVITKDVSTTTIFSFVMAFLNMTLAPFVVWKQLNPKDKFWLRALMTKSAARKWKGFAKTMRRRRSEVDPDKMMTSPIPYAHAANTPKGVGTAFMDVVEQARDQESTLSYDHSDDTIINHQPLLRKSSEGYTPQDMAGSKFSSRTKQPEPNIEFQEYGMDNDNSDNEEPPPDTRVSMEFQEYNTEDLEKPPPPQLLKGIDIHEYNAEDLEKPPPPQLLKGIDIQEYNHGEDDDDDLNGPAPMERRSTTSSKDLGLPPPKYERPPSGQFGSTEDALTQGMLL